ncbi:MAG: VIT1/CCC1 transporter family protein, partial [Clostridia bacterium]|nr:VIT1/CCC1 transporter family protein [Clostridia bacterium]
MNEEIMKRLLIDQQDEITAHHLYRKIAGIVKDEHNRKVVEMVAADEIKHYNRLKTVTGKDFKPQKLKIFIFYWMTRIFGLTFGIKYLERGEGKAVKAYSKDIKHLEGMVEIIEDEERHEQELISMIDEERLQYMGSVVLGLNDALVELTGALAGFTFAFQNTRLIALTGLITGISASFSMAASEYLSTRHEGGGNPVKSAIYTGAAYVFTVICLILPYLVIGNPFISLAVTLGVAVLIIFIFNY